MKADGRTYRRLGAISTFERKRNVPPGPQRHSLALVCAESLRKGLFSPASDVWMLGVTCFEMLTRGGDPYDWHNRDRVTATAAIADGTPCSKRPERCDPFCPRDYAILCELRADGSTHSPALITALEQSDLELLAPTPHPALHRVMLHRLMIAVLKGMDILMQMRSSRQERDTATSGSA